MIAEIEDIKGKPMSPSEPAKLPESPEPVVAEAWYVTDWDQLYEVDERGHAWQPDCGRPRRSSALRYVRWHVYGPAGDNQAYQEVAMAIRDKFPAGSWAIAWGLYAKLVEIAAARPAELRGFILGRNRAGISPARLEAVTGFTAEQIALGLEVLAGPECGWIHRRAVPAAPAAPSETPSRELPGTPGDSRELPDSPGESGALPGEPGDSRPLPDGPGPSRAVPGNPGRFRTKNETETETRLNQNKRKGRLPAPPDAGPPGGGSERVSGDASAEKGSAFSGSDFGTDDGRVKKMAMTLALNCRVQPLTDSTPKKQRAQIAADLTCLTLIAEHAVAGRLGVNGLTNVRTKSEELSRSRTVRNPLAALTTWTKARLREAGHAWSSRA